MLTCEHCGAEPKAQDDYWAVSLDKLALDTADFHPNHCPYCGAYHKNYAGWLA